MSVRLCPDCRHPVHGSDGCSGRIERWDGIGRYYTGCTCRAGSVGEEQ